MAETELNLDTRDFEKALSLFMVRSRRPVEEVMRQQAKLIVQQIVRSTPPGTQTTQGSAAKQLGERAVEADLAKIFIPAATKRQAESVNLASVHRRARGRNGRIKRGGQTYRVQKGELSRFRTAQKKKVGQLAAGWNQAAAKLGYKPPAWIWRHSSPSKAVVEISERRMRFLMVNGVQHAREVRGLERRVQYAVNRQTRKMLNTVEAAVAREAARF